MSGDDDFGVTVHSDAVVCNRQCDPALGFDERDRDTCRVGVLAGVGERFGGDTEQHDRLFRTGLPRRPVLERHARTAGGFVPSDELSQGLAESAELEGRRVEFEQETADLLDRLLHRLAQIGDRLQRTFIVGSPLENLEFERERDQRLQRIVVHLASDPAPLVFLCAHQQRREFRAFFVYTTSLGKVVDERDDKARLAGEDSIDAA